MLILLLDTSTEKSFVAISSESKVLASSFLPPGGRSAQLAFQEICKLCARLDLSASDFGAVACSCGPGTFTGMRVGAATAIGISMGKKIPLISFCSLIGFVSPKEGEFASVLEIGDKRLCYLLQKRSEIGVEPLMQKPAYCDRQDFDWSQRQCVGPSFSWGANKHCLEVVPDIGLLASVAYNKYLLGRYTENGGIDMIYTHSNS